MSMVRAIQCLDSIMFLQRLSSHCHQSKFLLCRSLIATWLLRRESLSVPRPNLELFLLLYLVKICCEMFPQVSIPVLSLRVELHWVHCPLPMCQRVAPEEAGQNPALGRCFSSRKSCCREF